MKLLKGIQQEFKYIEELFYPRICMACGKSLIKEEDTLCTFCELKLPKTNYHFWRKNPVYQLFDGRADIFSASVRYQYKKGNNVQRLLHNFKYRGYSDIGVKIGNDYGAELMMSPDFKDVDYIIPVPLHYKKERLRGFNQSERFAFGLSKTMKGRLETGNLVRRIHTSTQTKKTRFERWQNVNSIFEIQNSKKLEGKHLLIVDDVITTGSTIEGCYMVLNKIPQVKISVAAIASPI